MCIYIGVSAVLRLLYRYSVNHCAGVVGFNAVNYSHTAIVTIHHHSARIVYQMDILFTMDIGRDYLSICCILYGYFIGYSSSIPCLPALKGLEKCDCVWNDLELEHYIIEVRCRDLGHTDHSALESLSFTPHIRKLEYTGNYLDELKPNVFGACTVKFLNLTYIDFSNNNISVIHGKSFHCVPNVDTLLLNYNRWIMDPDKVRVFSNMPKLTKLDLHSAFDKNFGLETLDLRSVFIGSSMNSLTELHLEENNIEFMDSRLFCDLPNLKELYLGENKLTKIGLECLTNLTYLFVNHNNLATLSQEDINLLEDMHNLSSLNIGDNPYQCDDCSGATANFRNWLSMRSNFKFVLDTRGIRCTNARLADKLVTKLTDSDLKGTCDKKSLTNSNELPKNPNTKSLITGIILGIIGLLTIIFAYINRKSIQKALSKCRRRVHFGYHTMKNNDSHALFSDEHATFSRPSDGSKYTITENIGEGDYPEMSNDDAATYPNMEPPGDESPIPV